MGGGEKVGSKIIWRKLRVVEYSVAVSGVPRWLMFMYEKLLAKNPK